MVFLDLAKQCGRLLDLVDVGVGHLFDLLHACGCVFGGLDGAGGGETAQPGQFLGGIVDAQADERVAAAQMVVEEGERRADGEAVQPEGDLCQLDGQWVLVDAVDTAFEDHAADDGLVGELGHCRRPSWRRLPAPECRRGWPRCVQTAAMCRRPPARARQSARTRPGRRMASER